MSDAEYGRVKRAEIQHVCDEDFRLQLSVDEILFDNVTTEFNSYTTVFRTEDGSLYALCQSDDGMRLADVRRIIKSMNMISDRYYAPNGNVNYFDRLGMRVFKRAYPGRNSWTKDEAAYYRTLAPYSPALVKLAKVNTEVRRYNPHAEKWQKISELTTSIRG